MELDIVTLSALTIKNSFMDRLTAKIGMKIRVTMVHAVLSLMSGKPINMRMPTLPILANNLDMLDVKEINVVMALRDKTETVTKMVVT